MDTPEANMDVLHRFVYSVLDVLFPPSTEALCVRALTSASVAKLYTPGVRDDVHTLASFGTIAMKALVHEAKFHNNRRAMTLLGELLALHLSDMHEDTLVIPIPLSRARFHERGYNQVSEVASAAKEKRPSIRLEERILRRVKNTVPQTSLARRERQKNVADAFGVRDKYA